ncbi:MAG: GMC family oxidoreductase [Acidimicrobiia bacterium]|nr:GMC family oxidoreductase [Acidimicrobiia bacterium]
MTKSLTGFERRALSALVEAMFPEGGELPAGLEAGTVERIESWMDRFTPGSRGLVRAMLAGYELSPLLSRAACRFSSLPPAERERWLATSSSAWSARKESYNGIRTLLTLAFASSPEVRRRIGWDPSPLVPVTEPAPEVPLLTVEPADAPADMDVDVVIVGSGAGGAVAAAVLAEAGLSVAVLEEGPRPDRADFQGDPVDRLLTYYRDNGLTSTLGQPVISLPIGRAVGGTTVVNSGTCFRTPDWVLAKWTDDGLPGLDPDTMGPIFEEVEGILGVAPVTDDILGANGAAMARGAAELGWSGGPVPRNARNCHGHGQCGFGCPIDAKQAMHVSYLPRAAVAGARIFEGARVDRILTEAGRATGVVAALDLGDGAVRRMRVRARNVVLAAGAVFTPALLLANRLALSSGQVGRNLHIHPGIGVTALFDHELTPWKGVMQSWHVDERLRDGILLEATFPPPGIGYSAGGVPGTGRAQKDLMARYAEMASIGSIVSDSSSGRVRVLGRGRAVTTYAVGDSDRDRLVEGIAMSAEILLAAGAERVFPMLPGLDEINTREEVRLIRDGRWRPRDLKLSAYHPMSTCRMGVEPATSVVDSWGAVHDVPGLWVMDASILPASTAVNPQMTIMALVTRAARRLAEVAA